MDLWLSSPITRADAYCGIKRQLLKTVISQFDMRAKRTPRRYRKPYRRLFTKKRAYVRRIKRRIFHPRKKISLGSFPNTKTVNLRYVTDFNLDPGATSSAVRVFRANSIFDPDYTGIGHQPMYRDNYAAIYERYQVNHAHITFIATSSSGVVNTAVPITAGGTTTTVSEYYAAGERACRMFILRDVDPGDYPTSLNTLIEEGNTNLVWRFVPNNTSLRMPMLRSSVWPHTLAKLSKNDDTLKSDMSTNPVQGCYFFCGIESVPPYNGQNMGFEVILTFNVTFLNPIKNQGQN